MTGLFANVAALQRSLDFHSERHNVIASNIANANTPGFQPLELLRAEQSELGGSLPLARTEGAHIGARNDERHGAVTVEDRSTPGGLDQNAVSLEREMSKLAANDLRFESGAKMIARKMAILRYVANDANGS